MAEHLTDEEQMEALKRWWKDNGSSTVATIAIAVVGYFGWQYWETSQQAQAEAASAIYQQMIEASQVQPGQVISEESAATAGHLAGELKRNYASSLYAQQGALMLAKLAVQDKDLDKAAAEIKWVLAQNPDEALALLAHLRLAKVLYAAEQYDAALLELNTQDAGAFTAAFEDLKGDVLLAKGDQQAARAAYQLALIRLLPAEGARRALLEMKLNDVKVAAPLVATGDSNE